jgi:FtsP/CotA-like multicopper oxidase with cupredoxin domain
MSEGISRRSFLKGGAALLGGLVASRVIGGGGTGPTSAHAATGSLPVPSPGEKHFYLYATDGYLTLPDSTVTYIRGFAGNNPPTTPVANPSSVRGQAQLPAPLIDCVTGDDCFLHLTEIGNSNPNAPEDPHTVHLHGMHVSTQNDGFPETSFAIMGQTAIYYFKPENPGTFMYHCHVEASEHVQLGMYGALIVRPLKRRGYTVYGGIERTEIFSGPFVDQFDKEYVMLLTDLDTRWHASVEGTGDPNFNAVDFRPDYWLLNGRSFPDTILPAQAAFAGNIGGPPPGYDSYVHVRTGQRFLLRMINLGYQTVPWHIHGWHFVIVGKDASPLAQRAPVAGSLARPYHEDYTVTIGSGETYDLIIVADNKFPIYGNRSPQGVDYVPVPRADGGTHTYDGTPNTFFPQFYPMHNHDDYKVTNNGLYPGGQLTLIQSDAP